MDPTDADSVMVARVGQFLTEHFPPDVYLHRFKLQSSPLWEFCGVEDTRAHCFAPMLTLGSYTPAPCTTVDSKKTLSYMDRSSGSKLDIGVFCAGTNEGRL